MREMKDSGIRWMGTIPSTWSTERVKHGFVRKKEEAHQDNPRVLSLARAGVKERDISNNEGQIAESYYNYNPVEVDDLLINPMDLYSGANCSISKIEGVISPAYINLRYLEGHNPNYYDYYFKIQYWMMAFFAHGKGVSFENRWTLNADTLMNYPCIRPSYEEQCRIVGYLDEKCAKIDAIIEKQQAIIDKLKEYKLSIISEAVTKGLNPDVEMKDSGAEFVGKIPSNWSVAKLGNLFDFIGGYAFNSDMYVSESNNQVVRIGNVKNGYMSLDSNPVYVSDETAEKAKKFLVKPNYILFTMTGTKGKRDYFFTHVVSDKDCEEKRLYINQRVGGFVAKAGTCPDYYGYLLKDNRILDGIFLYETGTANQGNLGIDSISRTKVHVPPYEEQLKISEYLGERCSAVDKSIEGRMAVVDKLASYKKSLIYEVVTGKKEV